MSDFALVCNEQEMKAWMRQFVNELPPPASPQSASEIHVEPGFYPAPAKFPCLVTGFVASSSTSVTSDRFTWTLRVNCRYVYKKQAKRLVEQLKTRTPSDSQPVSTNAKPALAGVLMLAMLLELKEISAVKKHKLLETAEWVNQWLADQAEVDADLPGLVEKIWRASEAERK